MKGSSPKLRMYWNSILTAFIFCIVIFLVSNIPKKQLIKWSLWFFLIVLSNFYNFSFTISKGRKKLGYGWRFDIRWGNKLDRVRVGFNVDFCASVQSNSGGTNRTWIQLRAQAKIHVILNQAPIYEFFFFLVVLQRRFMSWNSTCNHTLHW